ncbi:major facilitator superfamily protein [Stylonychia lemnae]|uniref:Major facilitator superfamily protein n=1 Tax=Stylonychia lemnae TaxID=5949 RepID=A0A078B1T0_STYLE|nr:major facilitator superfamily protein [Stylonychia lemnae]|eukprot:CDW88459.1 major facilitator superfamily protein [Stylonychia lemnae]
MVAFIFMNFPSVAALDKRGLRFGLVIGSLLTAIGCWFRCFLNYSFWFAIVGQTIMAIAQPFLINAPGKVSGNWFGEKERIYTTAIGVNANILGNSLGYFLPSLFVKNSDLQDPESAKTHVFQTVLVTAIISTVVLIPILLSFQDKPPTPASYDQQDANLTTLKKDFVDLMKNKGFMLASLSNGMNITYFNGIGTVLAQMANIYGFSDIEASYLGTAYQVVGILAFILSYFALISGNYAFLMTAICLTGYFNLSIMAVAFEQGIELSYPIGEATSGGIFNILNNIFGFILILILTPILNNNEKKDVLISFIILGSCLVAAFIFMAVGKFELKRTQYYEAQKDLKSQAQSDLKHQSYSQKGFGFSSEIISEEPFQTSSQGMKQ